MNNCSECDCGVVKPFTICKDCCEHDSYTPTETDEKIILKGGSTYYYQEQKCDVCGHLFYEELLYLGTRELDEIKE